MSVQSAVQCIELFARSGIHSEGQPNIVAAFTRTHFNRRSIKRWVMFEDKRSQHLSELRVLLSHHFDGKGARVLDQRFVFWNGHFSDTVLYANAAMRAS